MGIFDAIKDRVLRREPAADLSDIRSRVVGEPPAEQFGPPPEPPPGIGISRFQRTAERTGFGNEEQFGTEEFGGPLREPLRMDEPPLQESDYDIRDRLNVIEAQLSAIRSQTETINERLKNMEMKLGPRRY